MLSAPARAKLEMNLRTQPSRGSAGRAGGPWGGREEQEAQLTSSSSLWASRAVDSRSERSSTRFRMF